MTDGEMKINTSTRLRRETRGQNHKQLEGGREQDSKKIKIVEPGTKRGRINRKDGHDKKVYGTQMAVLNTTVTGQTKHRNIHTLQKSTQLLQIQ